MPKNKLVNVYIVSDATGKTANNVVDAITSQFPGVKFRVKRFNSIKNVNQLENIIAKAEQEDAIFAHTIILAELISYLNKRAEELGLRVIDMLNSPLFKFSSFLEIKPELEPGLNHRVDENYFKRIKSIDFAVSCDDGKNVNKWPEADIVLMGISRTSKTPLSMYLAYQGYKTANIPLSHKMKPPEMLYQISSQKIVGLLISPLALKEIREKRLKQISRSNQNMSYVQLDNILAELDFAEKLMKRLGCMTIDVTSSSIEETAGKILTEKNELLNQL